MPPSASPATTHEAPTQTGNAYLGRQAIFDQHLNIWAYELLYRSSERNAAYIPEGAADAATSNVILNAFAELGLERVTGNRKAFINATHGALVGELPLPVPADQTVLEVLETVEPTPELIAGVAQRADEGFTIALDDFVYAPELTPLLEIAKIVKLDYRALGEAGVREHLELLAPFGVELLAEKLDTEEEFQWCRSMGFKHFQGYFLEKPQVLSQRRMPPSLSTLTSLMNAIRAPSPNFERIAEIVKGDPGLSVALLKVLNCAGRGLRHEITSIHQAITLLGLGEFSKWATMMIIAGASDRPPALLVSSLVRARTCECAMKRLEPGAADAAFTVGLFSLLDAMLSTDLVQILEELPVADEVSRALLEGSGLQGKLLTTVKDHERAEPSRWSLLPPSELNEAWLEAVHWADNIAAALPSDD